MYAIIKLIEINNKLIDMVFHIIKEAELTMRL